MSGSMCAAAWVAEGTSAVARIEGLGEVGVQFVEDRGDSVAEDVRPALAAIAAALGALGPAEPVRHAEIVAVRPGEQRGDEAEPAAVIEAIEHLGIPHAEATFLRSSARTETASAATVTLIVDGHVDADRLGSVTSAVRSAVGCLLGGAATAAPVGVLAAPCAVGPNATAVSMVLKMARSAE